jgi:transcriptional regulator with XRE-family HTH domain
LAQARFEAGLKQVEVAKLAKMNPAQLSLYENGHCTPTWPVAERLARVLGRAVGELFDAGSLKARAQK